MSQDIAPSRNNEYCPQTNITFTVTLPRIKDNTTPSVVSWTNGPVVVSGVSNLNNTPTQTTFTFIGKFRDVNINQVFKVNYATNDNSNATYDFPFKNIKSLFYANPVSSSCPIFQLNQSSITVPICQTMNIPISFNNIKWSTFGENPDYLVQ